MGPGAILLTCARSALGVPLTPGGVVANPNLFDHLYTYAWFVTFVLSAGIYLALMGRQKKEEE